MLIKEIMLILGISLGLPLLFITFFRRYHAKRDKKALTRSLQQLAAKRGLKLDERYVRRQTAIALDPQQQELLFIRLIRRQPEVFAINLAQLASCRLEWRKTDGGHTRSIILKLSFTDERAAPLHIPFYDEQQDRLLEKKHLFRKARYWKRILQRAKKAA